MVVRRRTRSATVVREPSFEHIHNDNSSCESEYAAAHAASPAPAPAASVSAAAPSAAPSATLPTAPRPLLELPVWAWRYGKERDWKSVRECKISLEDRTVAVLDSKRVLQRIAHADVQMTYNYVTSGRLIISSRAGVAMFLSLDKSNHQAFMKMLQGAGLPSREVSYGEFFRQQKCLTFPLLPQEPVESEIAEANAPPAQPKAKERRGRTTRAAAATAAPSERAGAQPKEQTAAPGGGGGSTATEMALVQQLQQQLQELQLCNSRLTQEVSRLSGVQPPPPQQQQQQQQQKSSPPPQPQQQQHHPWDAAGRGGVAHVSALHPAVLAPPPSTFVPPFAGAGHPHAAPYYAPHPHPHRQPQQPHLPFAVKTHEHAAHAAPYATRIPTSALKGRSDAPHHSV